MISNLTQSTKASDHNPTYRYGAKYLAEQGLVDGERLAIAGVSAIGDTTSMV
ncbi:MAG: hypothetical protein F6K41_39820 [Symploca sp. SIO3E6]|nr:hypothetical protein [Caldora sp. SIO3E6]